MSTVDYPRIQVGPLVPEAPEGQLMAMCSPAGGRGRLFPAVGIVHGLVYCSCSCWWCVVFFLGLVVGGGPHFLKANRVIIYN